MAQDNQQASPGRPGSGRRPSLPIAILLPAAGASRRMGARDKLIEPVSGVPLLRRQAAAALAAGLGGPVIVTLPPADSPRARARRAALAGLDLRLVDVPDATEGMSASLRAAAALLSVSPAPGSGGCAGLMVLPPDMPELGSDDLRRLAGAFARAVVDPGRTEAPILRGAAADGTPGHPVLLPARCFAALAGLSGDRGASPILQREAGLVGCVALPGRRALTDLDTPGDWAAWRATRPPEDR